jgi:hypothetical protein
MIHLREHYLRRQIKNFDMHSFDRPAGGKGRDRSAPEGLLLRKRCAGFSRWWLDDKVEGEVAVFVGGKARRR